ncbi:MAG: hypothetical protein ACXVEE_25330 [Polyangiales bacterium]
MRRVFAVMMGGVVALLLGNACNTIAGIDAPELAPPSDTGTVDDTRACNSSQWPSQPLADDPSDAGDREFVVAVRSMTFGIDPTKPLGYDLDGTCTCPEPDSCQRPADSGTRCDEPGGVDVAMNQQILTLVQSAKGFSEADLNAGLENGRFGALVQIRKYNGTANDVQVEVGILLSPGWSGRTTDAGPSWDGGDPWDIDPITLSNEAMKIPKYVDTNAYVRDGVLVATRLDGARLGLGAGTSSADIVFTESVLTGKIVARGSSFAIEGGIIAGRWPTANVLSGIANLADPFLGGPLCKSVLTYKTVKQKVCAAADIPSNKARDRGTLPCDALSLGIRFTAEPAVFGGVFSKMLDAGPCVGFTDECP